MEAPSSGPLRRLLSLWKIWAVILVLFAVAFAIAWTLVKGSVRRAEERRRSSAAVSVSPDRSSLSNNWRRTVRVESAGGGLKPPTLKIGT